MQSTSPKYLSVLLLTLFSASACSSTTDDETDGGAGGMPAGDGDTGGTVGESGGAVGDGDGDAAPFTIVASEANNFSFESTLSLNVQKIAPSQLFDIDWSAITQNFLGHAVDPLADIDRISMVLWTATPEEVAEMINANDANITSSVVGSVRLDSNNTITSAPLSEFTSFGQPLTEEDFLKLLDPATYDPAIYSYTVMIGGPATDVGEGVEMIQALQLDPAVTEAAPAVVSDTSTELEWAADLSTLTPVQAPLGQSEITIDWSEMSTTSYGSPFNPSDIGEVLVGRYSLTVEELEAQFLDIETIADELYRGPVAISGSQTLSTLTDENGTLFPGFTTEGMWVVGLLCPRCTNPTPWYVTIVEPTP
jgi:hypothetical protein